MAKALKSPSKVVSAQASKGSKKNSDCSANGCQAYGLARWGLFPLSKEKPAGVNRRAAVRALTSPRLDDARSPSCYLSADGRGRPPPQSFCLRRPRSGGSEQNVRLAAPCDRASRYHPRGGDPLWKPNMRKLITTIAVLALVATSVAIAQTAGSRNPAAPRSTNSGQQLLPGDAPVGHRQPRADQVPSENNPMDDSINRENAALDRMTKGICRGC
jgi:hypothetical protein